MDLFPIIPDTPLIVPDPKSLDRLFLFFSCSLFSSQMRHHPCSQLINRKRFRDIVISSGKQPVDPVLLLDLGSQKDNRTGDLLPDFLTYGHPVQIRQIDIQKDQIRLLFCGRHRCPSVFGCSYFIAKHLKIILQKHPDSRFIIYY